MVADMLALPVIRTVLLAGMTTVSPVCGCLFRSQVEFKHQLPLLLTAVMTGAAYENSMVVNKMDVRIKFFMIRILLGFLRLAR
jgi:hypothetical protein